MANKKHGKQSKCSKKSGKSKCIKNLVSSRYKKKIKLLNKMIPITLKKMSKIQQQGNEAVEE